MATRADVLLIEESKRLASVVPLPSPNVPFSLAEWDRICTQIRSALTSNIPIIFLNCHLPFRPDMTRKGFQIYRQDMESVIEVQGCASRRVRHLQNHKTDNPC